MKRPPLSSYTSFSHGAKWLIKLKPEYVWLGFTSRPKAVDLPEPSNEKMLDLMNNLQAKKIKVKLKDMRGIE